MALADNLLYAWELDEASGDALDSHGTADLAEVGGSIAAAAGPAGTDGARDPERSSTQYFESAGDLADLTGDTDLSWEIWFRPEQDGIDQTLLSKGTGSNAEYWVFVQGNLAAVRVRLWGSSGYGNENGMVYAGSVSANNWYHVVVTHDAAANEIAVVVNDGTPATVSHSAGIYAGTGTFRVGEFPGFGTAADGRVAKCRAWGRVLTGAEITELYNSGAGRDYAYITGGGGGGDAVPQAWAQYRARRAV